MTEETNNSWGRPSARPLWKRWWFWLVAAVLIVALFVLAFVVIPAKQTANKLNSGIDVCKERVTDLAKYPGGVEFVEVNTGNAFRTATGAHRLMVSGKVDFPNGFGTPVRQFFSCTVDVEDGELIVHDVDIM